MCAFVPSCQAGAPCTAPVDPFARRTPPVYARGTAANMLHRSGNPLSDSAGLLKPPTFALENSFGATGPEALAAMATSAKKNQPALNAADIPLRT